MGSSTKHLTEFQSRKVDRDRQIVADFFSMDGAVTARYAALAEKYTTVCGSRNLTASAIQVIVEKAKGRR